MRIHSQIAAIALGEKRNVVFRMGTYAVLTGNSETSNPRVLREKKGGGGGGGGGRVTVNEARRGGGKLYHVLFRPRCHVVVLGRFYLG